MPGFVNLVHRSEFCSCEEKGWKRLKISRCVTLESGNKDHTGQESEDDSKDSSIHGRPARKEHDEIVLHEKLPKRSLARRQNEDLPGAIAQFASDDAIVADSLGQGSPVVPAAFVGGAAEDAESRHQVQ